MLTDNQKQELSSTLKKQYRFFDDFYENPQAVRAAILQCPDLFVADTWQEHGHTLIELGDNNMWSCVALIEGLHTEDDVFNICHPELA